MVRAIGLALLLAGCGACPGSVRPMVAATLLFGNVGQEAFSAFLDRSVTPRFPAGSTVMEGAGRWRAGDGRMTQERSMVLMIVAPAGAGTMAALEAIRGEYKQRFAQESVGLVVAEVCAGF